MFEVPFDESVSLNRTNRSYVLKLCSYLGVNAEIVKCPRFESAIVKILRNEEQTMTEDEKDDANQFLKPALLPADPLNESPREMLSRIDKTRNSTDRKYIDLSWILGTSNNVERLFSESKNVMTDKRRHMDAYTFESIMFLNK